MQAAPTQPVVPQVFYDNGGGDPELARFQEHQQAARRPEPAALARTWMALAKHGVLGTVEGSSGFPLTSVVEYLAGPEGRPVFAVSTRSAHTTEMIDSGRISLTVTQPGFAALSDGRVTLQGTVRPVTDQERPELREAFLKKYPTAFYIDFGDFRWFIVDKIHSVRFNGGFAAAKTMSEEEYVVAAPDPVAEFSEPVCRHMNDDHETDTLAMIKHYVGLLDVDGVRLLDLDKFGMNAEVKRRGQKFKLRLPFIRPAENRKAIKEVIVEMTNTSRAATLDKKPPASV